MATCSGFFTRKIRLCNSTSFTTNRWPARRGKPSPCLTLRMAKFLITFNAARPLTLTKRCNHQGNALRDLGPRSMPLSGVVCSWPFHAKWLSMPTNSCSLSNATAASPHNKPWPMHALWPGTLNTTPALAISFMAKPFLTKMATAFSHGASLMASRVTSCLGITPCKFLAGVWVVLWQQAMSALLNPQKMLA